MKIKSICWLYEIMYGGVETRAEHLADYLSINHDVELIYARTMKSKEPVNANFKHKRINIFFNPYRIYRKRFWEEYFINKASAYVNSHRNDIDIIDGQGINAIPGISAGLPTITTVHGTRTWVGNNISKLEKETLEKADKIIANTKRTKQELVNSGVPEGKMTVIYNGVDYKKIQEIKIDKFDLLKKYKLNTDKKVILSVHNFDKVKNVKRTIDSFNMFNHGSYQLAFIGHGNYETDHKNYISYNDIEDVYFLGRLPQAEVYKFYRASDLLLLPSLRESWGNVYVEAMAAGCPVVLSHLCGVTEAIENMKQAVIINPYNTDDIKKGIEKVFASQTLRENLTGNGIEFARGLEWKNQGKLLENEIAEVLKQRA
ncbi:glycosyltransferase family 4 protein [Chloroflexota bacterium]